MTNLKQQVYDIVKRELTREYPWTQDPERMSKAMAAVKSTLEGSHTCALTVSWNVAWKEIGMKGKPTYKGLHALPGQAVGDLQPVTVENAIPRRTALVCNDHPEWGTWGVAENDGESLVIRGDRGDRVLVAGEFQFWSVVC